MKSDKNLQSHQPKIAHYIQATWTGTTTDSFASQRTMNPAKKVSVWNTHEKKKAFSRNAEDGLWGDYLARAALL